MRIRCLAVVAVLLAACEPAAQAPAAGAAVDAEAASLKAEAERACRDLTGYSPEAMAGKPADTAALLKENFYGCVDAVVKGDAPALRGRTTAPPT